MKINKFLTLLTFSLLVISCDKNTDTVADASNTADISGNLLSSGDSANDILSNDNFDTILVEIAYVTGFRPTASAINQFVTYLSDRTFKENIEIKYLELDSPSEDELTLDEIVRLETDNRTAYNNNKTLAIYIYFADAPAEGDELEEGLVTLGAVYRNTSMIIHEATIRALSAQSARISTSDIESATLNHEFGHLFGLVNLGTPMINNHESQSENSNGNLVGDRHCNVEGCLMRAELQFGANTSKSMTTNLRNNYRKGVNASCIVTSPMILHLLNRKTAKGNAAVDLDSECIRDLQANGGR